MSSSLIENLNLKYRIDGSDGYVHIVEGQGGLVRVDFALRGASCQVYLHGATVTSFRDKSGTELIWMSDTSFFRSDKGIRGGIPICWPQFGPGVLPQHGFARTSSFSLVESHVSEKTAFIVLELHDNEDSRKIWNFEFTCRLKIEILESKNGSLKMSFFVSNNSNDKSLSWTGALHTYFAVPHVHQIAISPLQNLDFFDKVTQTKQKQTEPMVTISSETDRIYHKTKSFELQISNNKDKSLPTISIETENFTDTVVWNPGAEKQKTYADLSNWENFVCVESAVIEEPCVLGPGQNWTGSHIISRRPAQLNSNL